MGNTNSVPAKPSLTTPALSTDTIKRPFQLSYTCLKCGQSGIPTYKLALAHCPTGAAAVNLKKAVASSPEATVPVATAPVTCVVHAASTANTTASTTPLSQVNFDDPSCAAVEGNSPNLEWDQSAKTQR